MRQVVLDTETTGLDPQSGHRIIEIGCIELQNRRFTKRHFHRYINPNRDIDAAALTVHGLTRDFLSNQPDFIEIVEELLEFIAGAELIIHNAPFDLGFLNHELALLGNHFGKITDSCAILDTLELARAKHPGQRNSLDALCKRYLIDNSKRELHGALLDAEILARVYLAMTSGQGSLFSEEELTKVEGSRELGVDAGLLLQSQSAAAELQLHDDLLIQRATAEELCLHQQYLEKLSAAAK